MVCDEPFDPEHLPDGAVIINEYYRTKVVQAGDTVHVLRVGRGARKPKTLTPAMPVAVERNALGEK
jgi:hypothetical protein